MINFIPLNDQVLIKADVKAVSAIIVDPNQKPVMYPSGVVVAVGKGIWSPAKGYEGTQLQPGDHVAFESNQPFTQLPIVPEGEGCYLLMSESLVLGKLEGANLEDANCPWFARASDRKVKLATER